jgi:hypothetical protein
MSNIILRLLEYASQSRRFARKVGSQAGAWDPEKKAGCASLSRPTELWLLLLRFLLRLDPGEEAGAFFQGAAGEEAAPLQHLG